MISYSEHRNRREKEEECERVRRSQVSSEFLDWIDLKVDPIGIRSLDRSRPSKTRCLLVSKLTWPTKSTTLLLFTTCERSNFIEVLSSSCSVSGVRISGEFSTVGIEHPFSRLTRVVSLAMKNRTKKKERQTR